MEHTFDKIASKENDYKICYSCLKINWYENTECFSCGKNKFSSVGGRKTKERIKKEEKFLEENGLDEEILYEV